MEAAEGRLYNLGVLADACEPQGGHDLGAQKHLVCGRTDRQHHQAVCLGNMAIPEQIRQDTSNGELLFVHPKEAQTWSRAIPESGGTNFGPRASPLLTESATDRAS